MNPPPRTIALLCLIQASFILAGFFISRSFLKIYDRIAPEMFGRNMPEIPVLPDFLRYWGPWCLLIPLLWGSASIIRIGRSGGAAFMSTAEFLIGTGLTCAIAAICTLGSFRAVTFGMTFH